jgi:hypothetical protein
MLVTGWLDGGSPGLVAPYVAAFLARADDVIE